MRHLLGLFFFSMTVLSAQETYIFWENGASRSYQLSKSTDRIVFYEEASLPAAAQLKSLPAAARAKRLRSAERILTSKLLVRNGQSSGKQPVKPVRSEISPAAGWLIDTYSSPATALQAIRWMNQQGWQFMPVFARQRTSKQTNLFALPRRREVNDPLFVKQWHLQDAQDCVLAGCLNLRASWDYVTGKGINVAIVDDGLEIGHADLVENTYSFDSHYHHNFNDGPEHDPNPTITKNNHGTSCAGIVAARGFNNLGLIGIAPEARLMGIRLIAGPSTDEAEGLALGWQPNDTIVHVSNNSWGPDDDGIDGGRMGLLAAAGIEKAATRNRDGLGTVVVFAAGNGRREGDSSSFDAYPSSRFAIAVGAVNQSGEASSYSEEGMNVAVSAFGGEYFPPDAIWTTNLSGNAASDLLHERGDSEAPVDYSDLFNGTSAAAPQVSGTVALMLERNPKLNYRDVKEILMTTARRMGLKQGDKFVSNGGGFPFSHSFGAGLIDVARALSVSGDWKSLGPVVEVSRERSNLEIAIPDGEGASEAVSFDLGESNVRVEHVEFTVTVTHPLRGDLGFVLVSPSGMESVAQRRPNDDAANFTSYTFTSVRHWGEASSGTWELRALDGAANGVQGTIRSVSLKVYGTSR